MSEFLLMPAAENALLVALEVAASGASICLIVLAAARCVGRRSAPLRYGILMAGIVALLAVPVVIPLGHALPSLLDWPAAQEVTEVVKVSADELPALLNRPSPDDTPREAEMPLAAMLGIFLMSGWALGVALLVVRLARGCVRGQRMLIGQPWQSGFWTGETKSRLAGGLGLKLFPDVYVSPIAPMPMVLGVCRPKILLPAELPASWQQSQYEAVLIHEAAHIARRDHWAVPAQRLAVMLFWWCPFVYLVAHRLNDLRESICDDYALQGSCDALAYAEVLIESAECLLKIKSVPVAIALLNSAHGGLEARVTRLLEKERQPMTPLSLIGKLGAGLLVGACLLTTAATAISGGQPAPAKKVQIKIIVDGKEIDLSDPRLWEQLENVDKVSKTTTVKKDNLLQVKSGAVSVDLQYAPLNVRTVHTENLLVKPGEAALDLQFVPLNVTPTGNEHTPLFLFKDSDGNLKLNLDLKFKVDPRMEQLIKAADAIKAGSGAQIRKALEAVPLLSDKINERSLNLYVRSIGEARKAVVIAPKTGDQSDEGVRVILAKPEADHVRKTVKVVDDTTSPNWTRELEKVIGNQAIVVTTKDGSIMVQLPEADLKKLLENANKTVIKPKASEKIRSGGKERTQKDVYPLDQLIIQALTKEHAKPVTPADHEKFIHRVELNLTGPPSPQKVDANYVNKRDGGNAADIEALRAKIEQLSAEIRALSQQLNQGKKQ